jgi:hypothetical protein
VSRLLRPDVSQMREQGRLLQPDVSQMREQGRLLQPDVSQESSGHRNPGEGDRLWGGASVVDRVRLALARLVVAAEEHATNF